MSRQDDMELYLKNALLKSYKDSFRLFDDNNYQKTKKSNESSSGNYFEKLKEELLLRYEDKRFDDYSTITTIDTSFGETLEITNKEKINFKLKDNNLKDKLIYDLKLIEGIGPKKEKILKNKGFTNIYHLTDHPTYSNAARETLLKIKSSDFNTLFNYLKSHKNFKSIMAASTLDIENLKFMDIETMGLSNLPIILIGVSSIHKNKIITKQYLQREGKEEPAIIEAYLSNLDDDSVHVSYNGASFDIPFIRNRADYFSINYTKHHNYDLLYYARNLYKQRLKNCRLPTVESYICKFERFDDVSGKYIPGYYKSYVETGNIGPLVPIVRHNRLDITSLVHIFKKIYDEISF
ncbi:ribonuclease H-like domain-containing protein [uncultured Methanobrevibacter sp.]|uniref:ribonuclease H-like domain-containing protein n=1 Tax=uncultured Methanobrevibacter sp. TaxID=253161 RepID=UPI0025CF5610|nr:ribonuclease H-like domain-containing protein [uncultured Methanobrevibacter sp.]